MLLFCVLFICILLLIAVCYKAALFLYSKQLFISNDYLTPLSQSHIYNKIRHRLQNLCWWCCCYNFHNEKHYTKTHLSIPVKFTCDFATIICSVLVPFFPLLLCMHQKYMLALMKCSKQYKMCTRSKPTKVRVFAHPQSLYNWRNAGLWKFFQQIKLKA